MIDIKAWLPAFLQALDAVFENRVWFVGLQGSYARGEATENSDIDLVVILDELSAQDIAAYDAMLDTLPHRELVCGFLSGKREILHWDPADLFQFDHDTIPVNGSLDDLLTVIDDTAVQRAVKLGICNIYHGCIHNMLYEKSEDILKGLYKSASFVLQAICYAQTGKYVRFRKDLLALLDSGERSIAETYVYLNNGGVVDFDKMSETLFRWAQSLI